MRKDVLRNIFVHLFMFETLTWGFAFTIFIGSPTIGNSLLYASMVSAVGFAGAITWGFLLLTILVAMTMSILDRQYSLGRSAAFGGYIVWVFAGILYITTGSWLSIPTVAIPNLVFWGWFYFKMDALERDENKPYKTDWQIKT